MSLRSRLLGFLLVLTSLATVPLLIARPMVPPPPTAARNSPQPTRFDIDGAPLPSGAIARAGTLRFRHGAEIGGIAFAPDGRKVFTAGSVEANSRAGRLARAWSVPDGRELPGFGGDGGVFAVAASADGKLVATGEDANLVRVWNASTGKELRRFTAPFPERTLQDLPVPRCACWLRFSPDGKSLVADYTQGTAVIVWDVETGKELRRIAPAGGSAVVDMSNDGRLAIASANGQVAIWDLGSGRLLWTVPGEDRANNPGGSPPRTMALSPDGKLLVTAYGNQGIQIWDVNQQKQLCQAVAPGYSLAMVISPDAKIVAVAYLDNEQKETVGLIDLTTGAEQWRLEWHGRGTHAIVFSPDGKTLATGGAGQTLRLWDAATGKEISPPAGHPGPITTVALSGDGKLLATCSDQDRFVRLWDTATGREIHRLEHPTGVDEVTLSPDGTRLASASEQTVHIWEIPDGRLLHKLVDHAALGSYLRFSSDSKTLATGSQANTLALWDCATGKLIRELPAPPNSLAALFTFNDGRLLAYDKATADEEAESVINLWDITGNRLVRRFAGHSGGVNSVIMSADGRMLASRGPDKTIRVWEVATGGERCRFREPGETRHTMAWTGTQFLAFSPDRRTLMTAASDDPFARRWDLMTGKELKPFPGHRNWIGAIDFSADGLVFVTGSQDTTCLIWHGNAVAAPVRPPTWLADVELARLWDELRETDAAKAYRAIRALAGAGDQAANWIGNRLRPAAPADRATVNLWIEGLDDPQFSIRERATAALLRVADQAEAALRAAAERSRSAEAQQRIRRILDAALDVDPSADRLREMRAVEVLEMIRTRAARDQLAVLAGGATGANLTREARAALRRLQ
ncbi:MAG TPA: PQQ-binding-like beta-propeller repeat protein [Gemmataceae bacterium]|jgi:WD40 repeat protein|nr:PQQ-binding-like beta-propeller repeat protein [Gemmataceae bacterium]